MVGRKGVVGESRVVGERGWSAFVSSAAVSYGRNVLVPRGSVSKKYKPVDMQMPLESTTTDRGTSNGIGGGSGDGSVGDTE